MIKSMTAFGRARVEASDKDITVEMRSVNSRYFDASVRSPRSYLPLEERIKAHVQKTAISRGKVDIYVTVTEHTKCAGTLSLDKALAEDYIKALCELRDTFGLADDISVMRVAQNRELFTTLSDELDMEKEWERLLPVLDAAISDYNSMREAEGRKTEADMREKMAAFIQMRDEVADISKNEIVGFRDKFEARIRQMLSDRDIVIDENRILAECSIYADKVAIDEELARLDSHRESFEKILVAKEPAGRKLDFLMQEFNRETNTIGSKANNAKIAALVVNMKSELEKIREQVQNVE